MAMLVLVTANVCSVNAGVPKNLTYQILIIDPASGAIKANQSAKVTLEIREGSESGTAVLSQEFNVTTDKSGICTVSLSIPETMDWSSGNFYLATLIDDKEAGVANISSVPYALVAEKVDVVTKDYLVGKWETYDGYYKTVYTFNDDFVGTYTYNTGSEDKTCKLKWQITNHGMLFIQLYGSDYSGTTYSLDEADDVLVLLVVPLSDNKMFINDNELDGEIYTKQ